MNGREVNGKVREEIMEVGVSLGEGESVGKGIGGE